MANLKMVFTYRNVTAFKDVTSKMFIIKYSNKYQKQINK